MTYLVRNTTTGLIENVIAWDGVSTYNPGTGRELIELTNDLKEQGVGKNWTYDGIVWTAPEVTE